MADLSDLLGDVYGGLAPASPDDDPVVHEPPASRRSPAVPDWAGDDRLDEVFADWTPGPGPDDHRNQHSVVVGEEQATAAPLDDDLAEALSAALASDPMEITIEADVVPEPEPARTIESPAAPSAGALFGGIGELTTLDTPAVDHVVADTPSTDVVGVRPWCREDDDILPGGGRNRRKSLRRR